ncbi:hypothetical protein DSL72_004636 [Monilinia vaccinii-corymbosi]|uniref:Fungal lipase-type domain-containing protein n=1 Tax=Monilinia vaccinii-corymbosi TaxID=61207 RepID=A0A8A3P4A8_9HELO|nr:hypothetical protein DSL72_004636 [Monilinia vaccinii-corymbosi]
MRFVSIDILLVFLELAFSAHVASPISQTVSQSPHAQSTSTSAQHPSAVNDESTISPLLFHSLEELARLVDISYCVGTSGISKPFQCASRCDDFPGYELVDTFNTGVAKSDSSGYIVLDHGMHSEGGGNQKGRIIVAFRGTYSIANTIVDLSTVPQEYIPYPEDPDNPDGPDTSSEVFETSNVQRFLDRIPRPWPFRQKQTLGTTKSEHKSGEREKRCTNCTVHTGFYTSWLNTRPYVMPRLNLLKQKYPEYQLHLVGHSLGGAVAALASLELEGDRWGTIVTTFGEPMIGNQGLRDFIDGTFGENEGAQGDMKRRYRRVTHNGDPVPLLPLREWGYRSHAGEIYIAKGDLQPKVLDIRLCYGDEDANCIAGSDGDKLWFQGEDLSSIIPVDVLDEIQNGKWGVGDGHQVTEKGGGMASVKKRWPTLPIPTRYKLWQLLFAHRDYFWRLGVCLPGGDPLDWRRPRYNLTEMEDRQGRGVL